MSKVAQVWGGKKQKTTAPRIPVWSPTVVLTGRHSAFKVLWPWMSTLLPGEIITCISLDHTICNVTKPCQPPTRVGLIRLCHVGSGQVRLRHVVLGWVGLGYVRVRLAGLG